MTQAAKVVERNNEDGVFDVWLGDEKFHTYLTKWAADYSADQINKWLVPILDQERRKGFEKGRDAAAKAVDDMNPKKRGDILWRRGMPELLDDIVYAIRALRVEG